MRIHEKKGQFPAKDVITLAMAAMAFVISGVTFYVNIFTRVDEIRLLISSELVVVRGETKKAQLPRTYRLVFMNTGSRPEVINEHRFYFGQKGIKPPEDSKQSGEECEGIGRTILTDFKPFVIKPGEVLEKEIMLRISEERDIASETLRNEWLEVDILSATEYDFRLCLSFEIFTPSERVPGIPFQLSQNVLARIPDDGEALNAMGTKKPLTLFTARSTLLSN